MTDVCDQAQAIEARIRASAENARLSRLQAGPAYHYCLECGNEIPAARREAIPGVQLCVVCQEYAERT